MEKIKSAIQVIRKYCVSQCCAGDTDCVKECSANDCPLWNFRMGKDLNIKDDKKSKLVESLNKKKTR